MDLAQFLSAIEDVFVVENKGSLTVDSVIEEIGVNGHAFKLVDFESEKAMLEGDRKARIIVAFASVGEHTWFFKIAGETGIVAGTEDSTSRPASARSCCERKYSGPNRPKRFSACKRPLRM